VADLNDFKPMPSRIAGERARRMKRAASAMSYHQRFLDDCLRALLPHDLLLLGAPSGVGKTDLALSIGMLNAMNERRVGYFALEAENDELEQRVKYAWLSEQAHRRNLPGKHELNFADWYIGRCEGIVGSLEDECNQWFLSNLGGMRTFYRGEKFGKGELRDAIAKIHEHVDLIIIDHLHYVDADEDARSEHDALGETTKTIRDIVLVYGKPIVLVAHLRKRDQKSKTLVPTLDDFHGSSNITKIATQVVTINPAIGAPCRSDGDLKTIEAPKWWLAPTFISILKDRRAGAPPFVAVQMFDKRTRRYDDSYTLGRLIKGGTEWEQIKPADRPGWANGHAQMELDV
jgi:hypothetical protein